jgi:hypothetical protein
MALLSSFYPQPVVAGTTEGTFAEGNDPRFGDGLEEAPEDGIIYGRKDTDWVDITEPANLQIRRGTEAEVAAITPLEGEPVWETDTKKLVVGDGATAGGIEVSNFPLEGVRAVSAGSSGSIYVTDSVEVRGGGGPFGAGVAGGTRGLGAIDLQLRRSQSTQIASAARSVLIGGFNNTASGVDSFVIASTNSSATGSLSVVIGSNGSTCSGGGSTLIGGVNNTVSGVACLVVRGSATNTGCLVTNGTGDRAYMQAYGNPVNVTGFTSTARAQAVQFILKGRTVNDTPTEIGSGTKLTIPENVALFGQAEICAIDESGAVQNASHYIRKFAIENLGGTTTLVGSVTTVGTDYESAAGLDIEITADDTLDYLKFMATGISGRNIRWIIVVRGCEMSIV